MSKPIVVIVCMVGSFESWELQRRPHPWHRCAGGGAVHSINRRHGRPTRCPEVGIASQGGTPMQRRKFITLLATGPMFWPVVSRGADRIRRVGVFLGGQSKDDPEVRVRFAAFGQALQKLGWTEGKNLSIEFRGAAGKPDQYATTATALIETNPDLILVSSAGLANV